ncbi:GNAT family N-acetyltransferase [Patescibacteria group bacterium]|nr:GNAT family N-acetyltransferase [Patescibacteria group bacterium]MBU2219479.1 GNAT family N-acetyltransferase [Patescibacteria group bacterium]MBU2263176.1 GNAT family N-acetyltransferase [Patescibacteria group bacterium]
MKRIFFRKGKKVFLRPVFKKDVPNFLVWFNDPEVTQWLSLTFPINEKEEEEWVENLQKRKPNDFVLMIETKDRKALGTIGLHKIFWQHRIAEIGIAIGEKKYWSKGYGTEATMLLLDYAFNTLDLRKVGLSVLDNNGRAYKCYSKCGFKVIGRRKEQFYKNGKHLDEIIMEVFKKDWQLIFKRKP